MRDQLRQLALRDGRYAPEAFRFLFESLEHAVRLAGKEGAQGSERHVTGQELLAGLREHALESFGPLAAHVWRSWRIQSSVDWGRIVFLLVDQELLRRKDYPDGKFTLAFVGSGDEASNAVLELTHNWDTSSYELGNGFGHIAIGTDDIEAACARVREYGGEVTREPGPMKHGSTVIAFVKDPDGYSIEFIDKS